MTQGRCPENDPSQRFPAPELFFSTDRTMSNKYPNKYAVGSALSLLVIAGAAYWLFGPGLGGGVSTTPTIPPRPKPIVRTQPQPRVESPSHAAPQGPGWFSDMTERSGVRFRHVSGTSSEKPYPAANGSGIATLDFDLDGLWDLYFATGTAIPVDLQRSEPINCLYRNRGDWQFEDVTRLSGLGYNGFSAGVTVGDYDNDGFSDVYVACYGENALFRNQGDGTFSKVDAEAGVNADRFAASAAFLDFDADGFLDIYVCNYGKWTLETNFWCGDSAKNIRRYCAPSTVEPDFDILYRNRQDGTFEDVTRAVGIAEPPFRAQGVVATDVNDDGWIDLYIGNDGHRNSLFINRGGRFEDVTETAGVGYGSDGEAQAGMGVEAADVFRDGRISLFVTNFADQYNAFYQNSGNGDFSQVAAPLGLASASMPWVGWGTAFLDLDLDGWLDLVVTNGHVDDNREDYPYESPPLAWKNVGGRFELLGSQAGSYFAGLHVGRALVVADLDNDGDQDLVIGHQDNLPALLRNDRPAAADPAPKSIELCLVGTGSNRDAIGSAVTMHSNKGLFLSQIKGGGSYLSSHDTRRVFAVQPDETDVRFEIRWPDRQTSQVEGLEPGNMYVIVQPADPAQSPRIELSTPLTK